MDRRRIWASLWVVKAAHFAGHTRKRYKSAWAALETQTLDTGILHLSNAASAGQYSRTFVSSVQIVSRN